MSWERYLAERIEGRFSVVSAYYDIYAEDPRKAWDNACKFICFHSQYNIGDEHDYTLTEYDELVRELQEDFGADSVILDLYMYDHSGIVMSLTPFSCPWDSGQVGFVVVPEEVVNEVGDAEAWEIAKAELDEYNDFLTGNVYLVGVTDKRGNPIDGFFQVYGAEAASEEADKLLQWADIHIADEKLSKTIE